MGDEEKPLTEDPAHVPVVQIGGRAQRLEYDRPRTDCPHPTAQNGQTDLTTPSAVAVRGWRLSDRFDWAARARA
jgi:hypothetical protein